LTFSAGGSVGGVADMAFLAANDEGGVQAFPSF
jgi:hypothetical protein